MSKDWEELDCGELYLKKVRSTRPQRGTNALPGEVKILTPEEYRAAIGDEPAVEKGLLAKAAIGDEPVVEKGLLAFLRRLLTSRLRKNGVMS
ncbi:MAG: hypothetical protein V5B34_18415 [Accumulibacter sp.]|jgi:hypothetical protein